MTEQLLRELREFRGEIEELRVSVDKLATTNFRQKLFNGAIVLLFLLVLGLGVVGFINAKGDRNAIRHEACVANQTSIAKARVSNTVLVNTLAAVLVEPGDAEANANIKKVKEELVRQQDELLPIPKCD